MVVECACTSVTSMEAATTPYKEGYLFFPPHGVLGQLKKSWHKKFCQLFKSSNHGIERLEIFESAEEVIKTGASVRIITLENCVKIKQEVQKNQPHVFTIVTKTGDHHFAALCEKELGEWLAAFQLIAFKDHCARQTIEEDNDLYCTSTEETVGNGIFTVLLIASEASNRCGLEPGPYTLVVTSANIQLRDCHDHQLLATWPYCYIRRYGYREGKFTFEAGRKCTTGEGDFHMEHSNRQEIFRCISSRMKNMRKMLSGDTPPTSGILCGDNQFQAALSMEPRSRSPLPPSPTSTTQLNDLDFTAISQSSMKPLIAMEHQPLPILNPPLMKSHIKPAKPPRKNPILLNKKSQEEMKSAFDDHRKLSPKLSLPSGFEYDNVEVRTEAWRTQGVCDMTHTECVLGSSDTEDEPYLYELPKQNIIPKRTCGPKILLSQLSNKSDNSVNYDTLQHFGSTSRLNSNPGYKHIPSPFSTVKFPPQASSEATYVDPYPSTNEYADIIVDRMQVCRLADDSHLGYGMIRKKSVPAIAETTVNAGPLPGHKLYNEMEYAVVQKPKKI